MYAIHVVQEAEHKCVCISITILKHQRHIQCNAQFPSTRLKLRNLGKFSCPSSVLLVRSMQLALRSNGLTFACSNHARCISLLFRNHAYYNYSAYHCAHFMQERLSSAQAIMHITTRALTLCSPIMAAASFLTSTDAREQRAIRPEQPSLYSSNMSSLSSPNALLCVVDTELPRNILVVVCVSLAGVSTYRDGERRRLLTLGGILPCLGSWIQ